MTLKYILFGRRRELKGRNYKLSLKIRNKKKIKAKDIIVIFQIKEKQMSHQPETRAKYNRTATYSWVLLFWLSITNFEIPLSCF